MQLLKNKVIFLAGGTEGIGSEYAKAYAAEGAKVVIAGHCRARDGPALETINFYQHCWWAACWCCILFLDKWNVILIKKMVPSIYT